MVFIGIFIGLLTERIQGGPGLWCLGVVCFVALVIAQLHAYRSTPRSPFTGKPMQIFRNLSAPEGVLEIIYVDEDSRTYFRNVYAVPPGDG